MRNSIIWPLCFVLCSSVHAQFKNKAALQPVNKTGFYSIAVTPELSSYIKTDFSDLRIKDDDGKPVPYVIRETLQRQYDTVFTKLKIIKNELADSGKTILLIENTRKYPLNFIALLINNNAVSRQVDISGGNDMGHWYSIVENGSIGKRFNSDKDKCLEVISIPSSSYRYFKLTIYNGGKDPLNILSVGDGMNMAYKFENPYMFNPQSIFKQVDSVDGYTYISVHDSAKFHKDFLNISFKSPRFFKRDCDLLVAGYKLCSFTVSSDSLFSTTVPLFNAQDWLIKVHNGDNPALPVKDVYTFKIENNIIAWLDSGKACHLEMNDSLANAPTYDLQNFKDSIPTSIASLTFGPIENITAATKAPSTSFFKQSWLWPVLIIVLVGLIIFTSRLAKEMGRKQ